MSITCHQYRVNFPFGQPVARYAFCSLVWVPAMPMAKNARYHGYIRVTALGPILLKYSISAAIGKF
jgi:hypothetical protein